MIDYSMLRSSLKRFEVQHNNYMTVHDAQSELVREAVAESVIRRFATCYDCLWKVLKRYLIEELGAVDPPNSPKPVFRLANENGLLPSQVGNWLRYADARTDTSHDYDGEKAKRCLGLAPAFIDEAVRLYCTLSGEKWN